MSDVNITTRILKLAIKIATIITCVNWPLETEPNHLVSALPYHFLLYELSDPVVQLAVDNTRNVLYCRTERGSIQVIKKDVRQNVLCEYSKNVF